MGGGERHPTEMTDLSSGKHAHAKHLVLILTALFPSPEIIIPILQDKFLPTDKYEIRYLGKDGVPTEEDLLRAVAVLGFTFPASVKSHKQIPKLRLVQLGSAGYGHIEALDLYKNLPADDPIIWASASGIHAVPIAEHVIASCMALYHGFPKYILAARASEPKWLGQTGFGVKELRGRTLGVLAYGHIGREVARMASVLGMKVLAANRKGKKEAIKGFLIHGVGDDNGDVPSEWYSTESKTSLHEFYSACDIVVNTLPASPATVKFVDEDAFRYMKNDALYCNIGRGDTTDQEAMIKALKAGVAASSEWIGLPVDLGKDGDLRIGYASLDVTQPEPLNADSELWHLENVLLTPHMSGSSELYWYRATDLFGTNVIRVVEEGKGALNAFRGRGEDD